MTRMTPWQAAPLAVLFSALCGCTTTMSGTMAASAPDRPSGHGPGILVNMTKPVFTVTFTPGAGPGDAPTGTLAVAYKTDLKHRYYVNLDPAFTSSAGLDLSIGTQGQLTSSNATATSNTVATIQMLGKLAATAVALGALDKDGGSLATRLEKQEQIAKNDADTVSCMEGQDVASRSATADEKVIRSGLVDRLKKAKDAKAQAELHYLNNVEFRWLLREKCDLEQAASALLLPGNPAHAPAGKDYKDPCVRFRDGVGNDRDELDCRVDEARKLPAKTAGLADLLAAANQAGVLEDQKTAPGGRAIALARIDAATQSLQDPGAKAKGEELYAAAGKYVSHYTTSPDLELVTTLVEMTPAEWTRRHVAMLSRLIAEATLKAQILGCNAVTPDQPSPACPQVAKDLTDLNTLRARTLGKLTELHLAQKATSEMSKADAANTLSADEYMKYSALIVQMTASIDQAQATMAPPAAAAPKTETQSEALFLDASQDQSVNDKNRAQWALRQVVAGMGPDAKDLPKYILVIDHGDEK